MSADVTGPVTAVEVRAVVDQLHGLVARTAEHGQQAFHFVLAMAAESLVDNLEVAEHWGDDE